MNKYGVIYDVKYKGCDFWNVAAFEVEAESSLGAMVKTQKLWNDDIESGIAVGEIAEYGKVVIKVMKNG